MNLEAQEHAGASSLLDYNTSFPQFQKLDPVIQRLIWEYTLPSSRVHYVEYIQFVPALVNPQGRYLNIKCPPVPITFSVSEQSRYVKVFQSQQKWKLGNNPFFTLAYGLQVNDMMHAPLTEFPAYRDLFAGFTPSQNITLVKIKDFEGFYEHRLCSRVLPTDPHYSYGIEFDEPYQATAFERDLKAWRNEQVAKAMMKGKTMPEIKIAEMALACECADVKERMEEKVRELNRAAMSQTLEQDRLE
ncbi:hypothetical protein NOF04DRAFT_15706 [Fusarium oxysporum II5]|uniref:2EXR domain-containing protein n=1 Tax=Fusarium odoratissimum (strain NRRL 54006) TaxID=1089451 RepID=X0K6C1_FUSO5|nr:uncharacterized protein FOIG_14318 [Fusarium odoratissimum NRRL 54006]EXL92579.1 hypothetical protein FOIG_14318 [Fusarium odoratissimum NRRL 54006]KAK2122988.1 hypothetical protein NOF04DRAFT_15706 [Fusarium oxysporum II5]